MLNAPEVKNQDSQDNLLPKKTGDKKTLVLDLDETLVHSQFQPFDVPSDITLKIELEDELHDIHVMVRPGVKEFLENMGKIYEIVIFTASVSKYADPLLDIIDKEKICKFRLFREHCTPINTCFVKEIKRLGRQLKDVVIVDNSPMSYALNPENGLPISTWFEDKEDRELYNISSILEFLSFVPDVRNYIHQFVVNDEISYNNVINVFDRYNEMLNQKKINKNNLNKNKSKDNKKLLNKNNSKAKTNNINYNNHLISENKENISNNILIKTNNNNPRFKKNITFSNLKSKENNDIKINLNLNKKIRPDSKNNNKSKENTLKNNSIIYNIEKRENVSPNILNYNNISKLNNVITDTHNLNQTTKNKNIKTFNFNPSSIIASVPNNNHLSNLNLLPNTTTHKDSFSSFNINKNNSNTSNNNKAKNNSKVLKHRKSDSTNILHLPKKIYDNTSNINNKSSHFLHSNSIVLNKKNKIINNSNIISNSNNLNLTNFTNNAQTSKNKNNKDFQISMRLNRDIGQELNKLEISADQDININKKLSKSLTKEKISVSFSCKNKINNSNYNNNTFCNKSSFIKTSNTNENANYIYHKKHKSINTSFIPFPSTTKNKENKILEKKYNIDTNKNNKNSITKYNHNVSNINNINKHKRFLSTSESYTSNFLNIYSGNISNVNNSTIVSSGSINSGNINNIFLNSLSYKNRQRNSQRKMNNLIDINILRTERNKENYNTNIDKKKDNKIPFSLIKKRNSLNENTIKKKIPPGNGSKNVIVNLNTNENKNKNIGYHKKNIAYNPEISGTFSVRPKSTKQILHLKNKNNINNYKVEVNISSHLEYNKKSNDNNLSISKRNINNKTKQISVSKSSRLKY